jgi:hypothetical protein
MNVLGARHVIGFSMQNKAPRVPTAIARLLTEGAHAALLADATVATWLAIEAALSPIIGLRGVAALYKRSLYLARSDFPWLGAVYEGALGQSEFASLQGALSRQSDADAGAASIALLQTFNNLLTSLIGESLSDRLLRSVWNNHSSGSAAQDPSP